MGLFKRIKNIIKSSINYSGGNHEPEIDINSYDDYFYDECDENNQTEQDLERKYYKVLEIEYGSDFKKIKSAYKRLLKKYHPDLFLNKPEKLEAAQKVTKKINEAYTYFERKYL